MPEKEIKPHELIIEQLENCNEAEKRQIFDHLRLLEFEKVSINIDKLPDLANEQFKIFDERKVGQVTPKVLEIRKRRYALFCYYYSHPSHTDEQMVGFIKMCHPGMSYMQAVRDLHVVKMAMGNMPRARKELMRFQVIEMFKHNYQKAEADGNIEGMNAAASGIARFTNLDKEDLETSWDELVPPDMEPSNDVKVLNENLKHYTDSEREQIRRKYLDIVNE